MPDNAFSVIKHFGKVLYITTCVLTNAVSIFKWYSLMPITFALILVLERLYNAF